MGHKECYPSYFDDISFIFHCWDLLFFSKYSSFNSLQNLIRGFTIKGQEKWVVKNKVLVTGYEFWEIGSNFCKKLGKSENRDRFFPRVPTGKSSRCQQKIVFQGLQKGIFYWFWTHFSLMKVKKLFEKASLSCPAVFTQDFFCVAVYNKTSYKVL